MEFTPEQIEVIGKVSDIAGKEYSIEQALDKMEAEWKEVNFDIIAYKYAHCYRFLVGRVLLVCCLS